MRLIQLDNIALHLPGRTLLENVNWSIFRGECYGLVGANGAGKTTLLKLMLGQIEASVGNLISSRDLVVGYLPQEGIAHRGSTLFQEAWSGLPDLPHLQLEIEQLHSIVADQPDNSDAVELLGTLQHRWEDLEGYRAEAKVERVLAGLGFKVSDRNRSVEEFSGGWQMRIALAKLLLLDPDLLLLDEPTNHLDLPALLWLESYLQRYEGALIVVSHDRRFLDRIVRRVAEIDRSSITLYDGNYSDYVVSKETRREQLEAEAAGVQAERKHIEAFVERFRYKASKARQVQSRIKQLERLAPVEIQSGSVRRVHFRFPAAPPSGRIVLDIADLEKAYGTLPVFSSVNVVLNRGEKVALVGANGAGKSTLCRLIAGVDVPTGGTLKLGHNVVVDYFAQEADFHLSPGNTVLEEMESEAGSATQGQLRSLLGAFLFSGDDVFKRVSILSGGEKSRLALAKMLLHPSNFIILDEPTNHLDMTSQDVLLDALNAYEGTLIVVSHDRYFLDRLVTRVLEMEEGTLRDWPGNLSEYLQRKADDQDNRAFAQGELERIPVTVATDGRFKTKDKKRREAEIRNRHGAKLKESRAEYDAVQRKIESFERRKREIEPLLADEDLYREPEKCRALLSEYESIRRDLSLLLEHWERIALVVEELEKQRDEELRTQIDG